jgi:HSP20 family protein
VNIGVTPDAVEIYAFAPGIDPKSLDVSVDKGLLTIAGQRKGSVRDDRKEKVNIYSRERAEGEFRRVVSLPEDADPDRVSATYRNGIVHISIQKREASRPRRIEVKDAR